MNSTLRPTPSLSRGFSDWLRPDTLFDKDPFELVSNLYPVRLGANVPSVNIKETSKEYALEVAAPGLERKDFNLEVQNHTLRISAEKEETKEEKKEAQGYSRQEYSYNSFSRSFILPENVKEGHIDAKYEKGILMVHIPKAKESHDKQVHKITVT